MGIVGKKGGWGTQRGAHIRIGGEARREENKDHVEKTLFVKKKGTLQLALI